jgi:Na+/H+ antiporter NhaD/arsenite permease-like protein
MLADSISIAIFAGTLALIVGHPRRPNKAWAATRGRVLVLLTGALRPDRLPGFLPETAPAVRPGRNIRPTMTTNGSRAPMPWPTLVRGRGVDISTRGYFRVELASAPLVLLAAPLAPWWGAAH